jgi:hypothetical protein
MYKVQSVLFNKSKFSLYLCKQWLKEHQYKDKDLEAETNFYHFRQFNPTSLKKQGYTEFRTKKLGKSGIVLIIAYKSPKSGGKISNDDLHHFIHASYSQGESYKGWNLDSSLSDASVQVYWNGKDAVVVHRGSQDAQDWYENGRQILGMNTGKRLEHSRNIQKLAEEKYGANNVITIGHSKGAHHAEEVGQNSREIYTLNKPVTPSDLIKGKKVSEKQTDIRTTLDPVSILRPLQQGSDYQNIWSKTLNPLTEHMGSVLNRVNPAKWWGKGLDGGRCWKGYEPVPGRQPYSKGSCRKISGNSIMKIKRGGGAGASVAGNAEWNRLYNDVENRVTTIRQFLTQEQELSYITELTELVSSATNTEQLRKLQQLLETHFISNPFFSLTSRNRLRSVFLQIRLSTMVGRGIGRSAPVIPMSVEERFDEAVEELRYIFRIPHQHRGAYNHQQILDIRNILDRIVDLINNNITEIGIFNLNTLTNLFERSINNNPHIPINIRTLTTNITLGMRNHFPANYEEGKQNDRTLSEHPSGAGAGASVNNTEWNKTERELRNILENDSGPFHPLIGNKYHRIIELFSILLKITREKKASYPEPISATAWNEIIPLNRVILHLYNDFVRDNPRFQHLPAAFDGLKRSIQLLNRDETRALTPREEEPSVSGRGREFGLSYC